MTRHLMAKSGIAITTLVALSAGLLGTAAWAQKYPVTPAQSATARQVAQAGVPLSELAADAPDSYTVKSGDTLWAISSLFLRSPWRWPELWGMNLGDIRNPHLIYPGQQLVLVKNDGRATLRLAGGANGEPLDLETVRLSPRVRSEKLSHALTTLQTQAIEPFLAEPVIVEEGELASAPRLVAPQENRVMLSRGDRAYARGPSGMPLLDDKGKTQRLRVFRNANPLKDPTTGEVLGYEAQFLGKAVLVRGESTQDIEGRDGKLQNVIVPATIDIVSTKEEMRVGDRMLPEPEREFLSYTPRAPGGPVSGRIVSVYGSAVVNAAQNQVVVINRGRRDGIESGHVMAILKDGPQLVDKTDPEQPQMKLPDERNGLLMVFKTFEKLSYALILDITDGVRVGDRLTAPR
ncbi:MAG: peptidoglycan-binding protein [Curvibacter sp. GWA2_64_110]|nr:MAG: peptidoglycan-binding protein [Curvibacter sp. GWA2_64_110]HCY16066.1 peptidoglycan-binding protein [Curvibacter sp.]